MYNRSKLNLNQFRSECIEKFGLQKYKTNYLLCHSLCVDTKDKDLLKISF